jgi:tRNA A-37 threonylcarbamoyl transferase component Bud32
LRLKAGNGAVSRKINGVRWTVTPEFLSNPQFDSLTRIDVDWHPPARHERDGRRQRWSSIHRSNGGEVFLKYYLPRSAFERIKYLMRPSRASAEWRNARLLAGLGVRVPELLAWGERRGLRGWRQSLLVTEALTHMPTLLEWSTTHQGGGSFRQLRRTLARSIATMHDNGLFHRDLHGRNILVDESSGVVTPYLLDFHEMLRLPRPVNRFCVDDLARLNGFVEASTWQRIRFMRDYLVARGIHPSQLRDWIKAVDRATRVLWDHYESKGRHYRRYE